MATAVLSTRFHSRSSRGLWQVPEEAECEVGEPPARVDGWLVPRIPGGVKEEPGCEITWS